MAWDGLGTPRWRFEKGLHEIGNGLYAWLQPDGGWGWSNAGLVVDGDRSLLVDTLFDLKLTAQMLDRMRAAAPAATREIDVVVNTHSNGDHTHGNQLVREAEIIASRAAAAEMDELPPEAMAAMMKAMTGQDTPLSRFMQMAFGPFEFEGIEHVAPTTTFDGSLTRRVGDTKVELIEVGPAHTRGDVLVHLPEQNVIFTGDILFIEGAPIIWAGPVANWIAACDRMLELGVEVVVPGHGPITDARGIRAMKAYLEYVRDEARARYDAGMDVLEAARDIDRGDFASWGDWERIVVNVATLYREFSGSDEAADIPTLFGGMAEIRGI